MNENNKPGNFYQFMRDHIGPPISAVATFTSAVYAIVNAIYYRNDLSPIVIVTPFVIVLAMAFIYYRRPKTEIAVGMIGIFVLLLIAFAILPKSQIKSIPPPPPTASNSASVTYVGEAAHAGPAATVKFTSDGYDLYGTAPLSAGAVFRDGAFAAGNRLTKLPLYVTSVAAPQDAAVVSAAGFSDYSIIDDPTHPAQQIRAGFETTHALNETTVAPLVEINLGSNVPAAFYVGFMTNIHANRPDDYPTTIKMSVGSTQAIAKTDQGGGMPSGDIDLYFFRINGARSGDRVLVSGSQSIRNPNGGRLNPSISGLLFTTRNPLVSLR
jgi:hypothetical protein